ncbi:MAG: hypothetical protein AB7S38_30645 [Vulcanimicrobiota bacterium]
MKPFWSCSAHSEHGARPWPARPLLNQAWTRFWEPAYYAALVASGRLAARLKLNLVEAGSGGFSKRRRRWAPLAVGMANWYLRVTGAGFRMLTCQEWLAWERAVHTQVLSRPVRVDGVTLHTPALPGTTLLEYLASSDSGPAKVEAITSALAELRRLHHLQVNGNWFTHGDAATHNVCYADGQAFWLDFERRHRGRGLVWCRAQDLLAFVNSAATALKEDLGLLKRALVRGYPDPEVLQELAGQARDWRSNPVDLQVIQAPWSYSLRSRLEELLSDCSVNASVAEPTS